jgi:hypothetical protein
MVFSPGLVGQVSLSVMTPAVLVMTRFWGAKSGNWGWAGGASTWSWPNWARVQLMLLLFVVGTARVAPRGPTN